MSVFFINPFLFEAGADFESIATVTVGSGGASSIEFTDIPGTYQHLQIRGVVRHDRSVTVDEGNLSMRVNGDTTSGNYYAMHYLEGSGSAASAGATSSLAYCLTGMAITGTNITSMFGAVIIDILDYGSTSKYKTVRTFAGADRNGAGTIRVSSSLWMSTSAISSLLFNVGAGNYGFQQHSTLALYGIKAP